jgi:PAS domain S-box-containing protein
MRASLENENVIPGEGVNHPSDSALKSKRLQRCMNDLIGLLAKPATWRGREPFEILSSLGDSLVRILALDFFYARLIVEADERPLEMLRASPSHSTDEIARSLDDWLNKNQIGRPSRALCKIGDREISIFSMRMGIEGDLGFIVAGSQRFGFPEQAERLVLDVAANQAAATLQHALLLSEQKRVASELDRRVAERTRELAGINKELQLQAGLLQHLPVSAWTLKPDGTPDFVNQVWLEFSGQTLDFVRSHPEAWMTAVHPEDRETALRAFWDGVRSGQGFAMETRSLRAQDGIYRWHLNQAVVLRDAEGKVLKFVGTTTDIGDQKRAEDALRASETNLRQIVDSIPGLICAMSPTGEIEQLNRPLLEYFGKTPDELKGWKMIDAVHPDDLPEVVKAFTDSVSTGAPYDVEHRCRRADGAYRWFQVRGLPVRDAKGRITGWYFLLNDIDDRKRAEEELRRSEAFLAEGQRLGQVGSYSWRPATDEVTWSAELYRIYELEIGVPVTFELIRSRVHPEDVTLIEKMKMVDQAREGGHTFEWRYRLLMPDHSIKYMHAVAHATRDRSGQSEYIASVQDVTARTLAEKARDKAQSELANVARVMSLGALTASIAHEVNQPLSGIITNASTCLRMLATDPPQLEGARETARRTIRDGNRMSEVIARLRALFSKKEPTTESVNLNDAVLEVIALSIVELQKNRVMLCPELADDLPFITGDRVQLQQVILNLLRNGSDAMSTVEDRPRQLVIRTERDDGDRVRLTVQDAGIGFDPRAADRLFDAFYTTKGDGMGIGLSVSRSIIERHQGRLWATLNDGPGAAFSFSIPRTSEGLARADNMRSIQENAVSVPGAVSTCSGR